MGKGSKDSRTPNHGKRRKNHAKVFGCKHRFAEVVWKADGKMVSVCYDCKEEIKEPYEDLQ